MTFLEQIAKALGIEDASEEKVLEHLETSPLADVVKALELDEDADSAKVVEAITALKSEQGKDEKSLEERAEAEGKVVLDSAEVITLKADAKKGAEAKAELVQAKFDAAFEKALDELRVDAKPETRERFQKLYDADAETCLEQLEKAPKIASTEARGKTGKAGEAAPEGVDAERHELDQKVRAYVKEHPDVSYVQALDIVTEEVAA